VYIQTGKEGDGGGGGGERKGVIIKIKTLGRPREENGL
jgi:hypothetical protein